MSTRLSLPKDIHIAITDSGSMLPEMRQHLADVFGLYLETGADEDTNRWSGPTLRIDVGASLSNEGLREMELGVFAKQGEMLDSRFRVHIERLSNGDLQLESPTSALEWLVWIVQLMLLERESTFVHCAAMEKDGKAILFPSWGGVGKTAITKHMVTNEGWKLLGDDLVIIDRDGTCYAFPRAMVLYPYHRSVFPDVFAQGKGPVAPTIANSALTRIGAGVKPLLRQVPATLRWARKYNPQSVRIAPSEVFGVESLSRSAELSTVVWIERDSTIHSPTISSGDENFISRIVGSTLSEFNRHCTGLTPTLFGLGVFSYQDTYGTWQEILEDAFENKQQWMVSIPVATPVSEVPNVIMKLMDSVGD